MGMFDSFLDANDNEWQTKAYDLFLDTYRLGDRLPIPSGGDGGTYQVEIFGGRGGPARRWRQPPRLRREGRTVRRARA